MDARLWKQAVADNPDTSKFIPVPLVGFKSLQSRISAQEAQNKAQAGRLDTLAEEIHSLKKKQADACAALTEAKRKQSELAHRQRRIFSLKVHYYSKCQTNVLIHYSFNNL